MRGRAARFVAKETIFFQSLKSVTQTVERNKFSMGHINRLRGVVNYCMDCQKPRCIYSMQAIAKMKPAGKHTKEVGVDCKYDFFKSYVAFILCCLLR